MNPCCISVALTKSDALDKFSNDPASCQTKPRPRIFNFNLFSAINRFNIEDISYSPLEDKFCFAAFLTTLLFNFYY